ncbi:MAG: PTS glucose transporter subunit IIA, partial [Synergistaceae bacterium]|nr:PTS glucose transporter subunit IIA [Synergistaceae bacterium]
LIHVGIDTVEMNGDGFVDFVSEGDKVTKGQKLMSFDRAKIKAAGKPETVVVLLTNSDDYQDVKFG